MADRTAQVPPEDAERRSTGRRPTSYPDNEAEPRHANTPRWATVLGVGVVVLVVLLFFLLHLTGSLGPDLHSGR
jgi:type VI protein secretion system component VasF